MRFAALVTIAVATVAAAGLLYAQSGSASAPAAGSAASAR